MIDEVEECKIVVNLAPLVLTNDDISFGGIDINASVVGPGYGWPSRRWVTFHEHHCGILSYFGRMILGSH